MSKQLDRKKIDLEAMRDLKKIDVVHNITYSLTVDEEKFWGTNYTIDDIVQKVRTNNKKVINRIKENISGEINYKSILNISPDVLKLLV